MSQPLWFLRHAGRIIGPYPAPQVREFLQQGEITPDWEISLDEVDWLPLGASGQFDLPGTPADAARRADAADEPPGSWQAERARARQRWLHEGDGVETAAEQAPDLEQRVRAAQAEHQARTDALLQARQRRRPPLLAGLVALLVLAGLAYFIGWGERLRPAAPAGVSMGADCTRPPGEAVNWRGCDLAGLAAVNVRARNMLVDGANLQDARLAGADLSYGSFTDTRLRNADLRGARLVGADLARADLTGADLTGADLGFAVLRQARLQGVRLAGARLGEAVWSDGRVCAAHSVGACL